MDKREYKRLEMRGGKLLDPIMLIIIILILAITPLSFINLSPTTHEQTDKNVLGVEARDTEINIQKIVGRHKYIFNENLKQISKDNYKYTTQIKRNSGGRLSKPIFNVIAYGGNKSLDIKLSYINSKTPKISIVNQKTNYILQDSQQKTYKQKLLLEKGSNKLYLLIENARPVLFDQYLEITLSPSK